MVSTRGLRWKSTNEQTSLARILANLSDAKIVRICQKPTPSQATPPESFQDPAKYHLYHHQINVVLPDRMHFLRHFGEDK